MHPLRVESLFPTVLWLSPMQALVALKASHFRGLFSQCRIGLGAHCGTWTPHSLRRTSAIVIIFPLFVGHLPRDVGIDYTSSLPLLPMSLFLFISLVMENLFCQSLGHTHR